VDVDHWLEMNGNYLIVTVFIKLALIVYAHHKLIVVQIVQLKMQYVRLIHLLHYSHLPALLFREWFPLVALIQINYLNLIINVLMLKH
jgi:hypothetical protein